MTKPIWIPSKERIRQSNLKHYMDHLGSRLGREFKTYDELYEWSVTDLEQFWQSIWEYAEIRHSVGYTSILKGTNILDAEWFAGARLNFAENLLRYDDDHPAIVALAEDKPTVRLSYNQLYVAVAACAAGMKRLGLGRGDRVAAMMPNIPETIIAMLACTSLGAIWSSCSPDFGVRGVLDRFGQIEPRLFISVDGYRYNGKSHETLKKATAVGEKISSIEKLVIVPHLVQEAVTQSEKSLIWSELLADSPCGIDFAQLPFDHPVYIMYSSGTTGAPKCIVHGAGGTLLQHAKEHLLHTDIKRNDIITYYTTCGWMMWNWLVSGLASGATLLLYDGSPSYPDLSALWRAVESERISIFGTSPRFLSACEAIGLSPRDRFDLSSLKTILSTGSPLSIGNFQYVYEQISHDLQLASISGGTDIISCFMLGNPILPVYPGEVQCRGLGMKVETYDDGGQPVHGVVGELVCTAPFPSRPVFFWNDPDQAKYKAAYFEHFPGVWRHGDYVRITEHGGVIVQGRSDATLNPGGVRIGTSEIYEPIESLEEVVDSLVVGQKWGDDIRVILFVVLAKGHELTEVLTNKIRETIRSARTPRHVPSVVVAVSDIPRTLNGKKVEVAVSRLIHGEQVTNREALVNPESLEQFRNLPQLRSQERG